MLEDAARRIPRHLRRRGLFADADETEALSAPERASLVAPKEDVDAGDAEADASTEKSTSD